ncbi:Rqc2 family fibronectin-binding protein [Metabacillus arenae]|uniref:Rqc2 homolog RqcH n=1 Tax=Metabacillus arenae TaxID=2771434 RepID=A0A926NLG9_9BACI|nr:NFACT RNA binding domain-containing protein [Metabacillus arenae]MBD1379986.1 NFACT family protein [Metabacillus arenae]
MSFDGMFTYAMTKELKDKLENGRISKIHQPYKNELILQIRANGENLRLIISAHPSYSRIHLTQQPFDNPNEPPMFCMLLRKHLEGGIIEKIEQVDMERIMTITIRSRNEIGDLSYKKLFIEVMGKHSNIILTDVDRNMILDSIKHISPAVNRHRTVLPGHEYVLPPEQNKANPLTADEETVLRKIDFQSGKLDSQLVQSFSGISPLFAKEVIYQAKLANRVTVPQEFISLVSKVKEENFIPTLIETERKVFFYFIELAHLKGTVKTFPSLSILLDRFYYGKAERDRVKQQAFDLERFIGNEGKKNRNKIKKLQSTLKNAENADVYKLYGELITANMYGIKKGDQQTEVLNYYEDDHRMVTIPLNPLKSPSENAQAYFQKYQKAKNSISIVKEQIRLAAEEVTYFDNLLQQLESASPKDIEEIREELTEGGYLKKRERKSTKKNKQKLPTLEKYQATDGTEILVGKNNKQNEYLTNKVASRDDIWLHTKDIPGSHVVIRKKEPNEHTILEAAALAAYFSKAKNSSSVPVDFTKVRHVKKPSGAKPGFVIYDQQQTVYVTPKEETVIKLKKS